ncbi:hypothetical protein BH11ARM2_BH11ARM2_25480 [soil metagenome]
MKSRMIFPFVNGANAPTRWMGRLRAMFVLDGGQLPLAQAESLLAARDGWFAAHRDAHR